MDEGLTGLGKVKIRVGLGETYHVVSLEIEIGRLGLDIWGGLEIQRTASPEEKEASFHLRLW